MVVRLLLVAVAVVVAVASGCLAFDSKDKCLWIGFCCFADTWTSLGTWLSLSLLHYHYPIVVSFLESSSCIRDLQFIQHRYIFVCCPDRDDCACWAPRTNVSQLCTWYTERVEYSVPVPGTGFEMRHGSIGCVQYDSYHYRILLYVKNGTRSELHHKNPKQQIQKSQVPTALFLDDSALCPAANSSLVGHKFPTFGIDRLTDNRIGISERHSSLASERFFVFLPRFSDDVAAPQSIHTSRSVTFALLRY